MAALKLPLLAGSLVVAALIAGPASASDSARASASDSASDTTAYTPMKPFEALAGKVLRGKGTGPDGAPITDIAEWAFILGGRALQATHRLENSPYGGRTIFFYDEGSQDYLFHYFTTAGFHTTGTVDLTDNGFTAIETVIGHETIVEVRSRMTIDGDRVTVSSVHIDRNGAVSESDGMTYEPIDGPGPVFATINDPETAGNAADATAPERKDTP